MQRRGQISAKAVRDVGGLAPLRAATNVTLRPLRSSLVNRLLSDPFDIRCRPSWPELGRRRLRPPRHRYGAWLSTSPNGTQVSPSKRHQLHRLDRGEVGRRWC